MASYQIKNLKSGNVLATYSSEWSGILFADAVQTAQTWAKQLSSQIAIMGQTSWNGGDSNHTSELYVAQPPKENT